MIPLSLRLKKESHRKIASAQDRILALVYREFPNAVLHGGTAIWRCYAGKRFSEDLDFYLPKDHAKLDALFATLEKEGFRVVKRKVGERSVYSELEIDRVAVRLEATYQPIKGQVTDYETVDGNITAIYSLTPEAFLKEKVAAYLKRRKVRDLYDIFFLLPRATTTSAVKRELALLLASYQEPVDTPDLKVIVLEGLIPTPQQMRDYIERKWRDASTETG